MIKRFLINDEYQLVYVFDEDSREKLIIADFAIKTNNEELKDKNGYIDYILETKYGKIVKVEICKTKLATFICSVIFIPKTEITNDAEAYEIYNDLKAVLTKLT